MSVSFEVAIMWLIISLVAAFVVTAVCVVILIKSRSKMRKAPDALGPTLLRADNEDFSIDDVISNDFKVVLPR